jgi:uncharacterized membrane protein YoaK (UPF0700 family)
MTAAPQREPATINLMLVALTFSAGYLDAVSYLGLGHVFTANMTGNTVLLGIAIAGLHTARVVGSLIALAGFCTGVALGTLVLYSRRSRAPDPAHGWRTLASETGIILLLMVLWSLHARGDPSQGAQVFFIALSAIAMGMQTEAARCMSIGGVATTYVTGTLSDLSAALVARALGNSKSLHGRRYEHTQQMGWRFLMAVWPVYVTGGAAGAFAVVRWTGRSLLAPIAIVGLASAIAYLGRRGWS